MTITMGAEQYRLSLDKWDSRGHLNRNNEHARAMRGCGEWHQRGQRAGLVVGESRVQEETYRRIHEDLADWWP